MEHWLAVAAIVMSAAVLISAAARAYFAALNSYRARSASLAETRADGEAGEPREGSDE